VLFLLSLNSPVWAYDWTQDADVEGAWLFEEGTGTTVTDSSPNTNTGNFKGTGEPAWSTTVPTSGDGFNGTSNWSVLFDGSDDYIDVGSDTSLDFTTAFSFVSWVQPKNMTGERPIFVNRSDDSASFGIDMRDSGKIEFYFNVSGTWRETKTSNVVMTVDQFDHIAIAYGAGAIPLIYINGSAVATNDIGTYQNLPVYNNTTYIGKYSTTYGNHIIDDTACFSAKLDSTDINDIMDNGLVQATATYYPFKQFNHGIMTGVF